MSENKNFRLKASNESCRHSIGISWQDGGNYENKQIKKLRSLQSSSKMHYFVAPVV